MEVQPALVKAHHIIHSDVGAERGQIDGATVKSLTVWPDDRGHFAEVFRDDEKVAQGFEVKQTSVTVTRPGVIKAFHYHLHQDDVFVPVRGTIRIALVDFRTDSPTYGIANSIFCGERYLRAVRIPKGVAHGYEVLPGDEMVMVYYTNQHYNPKDEFRFAFDDSNIGFPEWGIRHR